MDCEVMDVERTCRGCLKEGGDLRSLFTIDENSPQHEPRLNEMLMSSTQIQIRENDGLPSQICERCSHQLYSAYSFKHMCEVSDAKLKKLASNVEPPEKAVKEEHLAASGNSDIIDFNTMFTSDLPSIKVEVRDLNEASQLYVEEVKKDEGIMDPTIAALKNNEKCTQTNLTDVIQVHNCSQCQKKFRTIFSLSSHMKKHMATNVIPCAECGKFYISQELVQKHMLQIHGITNAKKKSLFLLKCQLCKLTFKKSENLKKHMAVHGKKKIYNCENCELGYNKYENYQSHLSSCNGKVYSCLICKKRFKTTEALSLHKNLVHERDDDFVGDNKIEILPIELPDNLSPKQVNGVPEKSLRTVIDSEMTTVPHVTIKDEPLDELLEEAERENLNYEEDGDSYTDMLADNPMDDHNSEEIRSDCSEYKPIQLKKRKGLRGRKRQFDPKRKHKLKRLPKAELDEIGEFPCTLCDRVLTTEINLKVHMAKHTGDTILFSCVICEKTFNNVHRLRRHELAHESFNKYKCNTCDKSFNRQDHLNKHMWSHVDTKPYTCDLCPKGFFKAEHLERHKMALHSGKQKNPKTAFCSICNRGFTTSKYLDTHMRMHTGDKTFTCKVCDKSFNSKWHLKEHNKWHSAEKPFLCSECGQRFIRNDYLVIHMRRHKGEKPYKCKFCGKGFPRATDLTVHERYHTGEKTHLCTICGKGFQRQYNLTVHLRVHTGEKPYVCSYCGKRFAQGNDLKSHVRRHTGERFNCEICGEGFIQGYHLTQHKRSVHGIDCTSHIRRVEKHPEANPQNQPNQIPKHRTRVTSSMQIVSGDTTTTEEPVMPPLHIFTNASQAVTVSQESDNDQSTLQSQLSAEEVDQNIPPLVPIVPVALFASMHPRMH